MKKYEKIIYLFLMGALLALGSIYFISEKHMLLFFGFFFLGSVSQKGNLSKEQLNWVIDYITQNEKAQYAFILGSYNLAMTFLCFAKFVFKK